MSHQVTATIADKSIVIETGKFARQAHGSVMVRLGDTVVLVAAVGANSPRPGQDWFPLTVDYREKASAAGRFPRRLLQARRPPHGEGNPHLPLDRPPHSPAVSERVDERGASPKHRPERGRRERFRHAEHHRRVSGPQRERHSLGRPARRRAHRSGGRKVHRPPHPHGNGVQRPGPRLRRQRNRRGDVRRLGQ